MGSRTASRRKRRHQFSSSDRYRSVRDMAAGGTSRQRDIEQPNHLADGIFGVMRVSAVFAPALVAACGLDLR
jgi:hypothetical protein